MMEAAMFEVKKYLVLIIISLNLKRFLLFSGLSIENRDKK